MERPIPRSYWVREGTLLAGVYPGEVDDEAAREKIRSLLRAGVTFFLDLTEEGEYTLKPYLHLLKEVEAEEGRPAQHRRMAIRDLDTPSVEEMTSILDEIDRALADKHIVYVHCWGGIGRTGTVVGCFLARNGMPGEEAIARIAELRRGTPKDWRLSPEMPAQCEMVRAWPVGRGESDSGLASRT
jgi:protein-tyrosine phosphatase